MNEIGLQSGGRGDVLLVDDRQEDRELLCRRLQRNGFLVTSVEGGMEALQSIEAGLPDVVLLDIHMPDLDGFSVLEKIRANYSHVQLPVMMLTVRNETKDKLRAFRIGANDYLTHFMDFPLIVARICTQIAIKKAAQVVRRH